MRTSSYKIAILFAVTFAAGLGGCASGPKDGTSLDTTSVDALVIDAPYDTVWTATRDTLREMKMTLYIRDTRGMFVANTPMKRRGLIVPYRTQFTMVLEKIASEQTKVTLETLPQRYWVSLLTYPAWRDDSRAADPAPGQEILRAIESRVYNIPEESL